MGVKVSSLFFLIPSATLRGSITRGVSVPASQRRLHYQFYFLTLWIPYQHESNFRSLVELLWSLKTPANEIAMCLKQKGVAFALRFSPPKGFSLFPLPSSMFQFLNFVPSVFPFFVFILVSKHTHCTSFFLVKKPTEKKKRVIHVSFCAGTL